MQVCTRNDVVNVIGQLDNSLAVADPEIPVGGRGPCMGGVDSRGGYVSKILYVKMKESGPLRSANEL